MKKSKIKTLKRKKTILRRLNEMRNFRIKTQHLGASFIWLTLPRLVISWKLLHLPRWSTILIALESFCLLQRFQSLFQQIATFSLLEIRAMHFLLYFPKINCLRLNNEKFPLVCYTYAHKNEFPFSKQFLLTWKKISYWT
jgi:hypothetical protein